MKDDKFEKQQRESEEVKEEPNNAGEEIVEELIPESDAEYDFSEMAREDVEELLKSTLKKGEDLKSEAEAAKKEAADVKNSWLRTAADFENYKKRNDGIRQTAYRDGKTDVLKKILPIGDSLDRALTMNLDEKTRRGIEMTANNFEEVLKSLDVSAINPVGEPFDPNTQECIMKTPAEEGETEGTVKQVFLKGYKLGDKVIRYAQVVVIG